MPTSLRSVAAPLVLAAVLTGGCGDAATIDEGPPLDERIAAVAAARERVGPVAAGLASAATTVGAGVLDLYTASGDPDDRLAATQRARRELVARLDAAMAAATEVDLPTPTSETVAIADALRAQVDVATELRSAATADLDHLELLLGAEATLRGLAASWQAPGSRSEQLERLTATAEAASVAEGHLGELTPRAACSRAVAHRLAAARHVVTATTELRELVAAHQGEAFDARRRELEQDPFGLERSLDDLDAEDATCLEESLPTSVATAELLVAAERVEQTLNPPELSRHG